MFTTFAELFAQNAVAEHEAVAHNIRVMHNLHKEVGIDAAMLYFNCLEQGTVRPVEKDVDLEETSLEAL